MMECMKIVKANQYDLLANYDRRHEKSESEPFHLLENYDTTHENRESKLISSLSKLL